jgi:hypothetical protein
MKKILKIKYSPQARLKETNLDVELLEISEKVNLVNLKLNVSGSYFSDKNKNYNLVLLTDEELKGLEGKTK